MTGSTPPAGSTTQCGAEAFDSANDGMCFDIYCLQVDDNNPIDLILDANGTNMTGDYVIQKSSNVYDCGVVTNEQATWGAIKGMYR
jgi:hypothetical protein